MNVQEGRTDINGNPEYVYDEETQTWVENPEFRAPESGRMDKWGNPEFIKEDGEWVENSAFVLPEEGRMDGFGELEFIQNADGTWVENPEFDATTVEADEEAGRVDASGNYEFVWNYTLGKWIANTEFVAPAEGEDPVDPNPPAPPAGDDDDDPEPDDTFDENDPNSENVPEGYVWCDGPSKWVLQPANPSTDVDDDGNPEYIWDGSLDDPAWVLNPDYNAVVTPPVEEFDPSDPDSPNVPDGYVWCEGPKMWVEQPEIPSEVVDAEGRPMYIWDGNSEIPSWIRNPEYDDSPAEPDPDPEEPDPEPDPEPTDEFDPTDPNAENVPEGYVWCDGPAQWVLQPDAPEDQTTDENDEPLYIWDGDIETPAWVINPAYTGKMPGDEDINVDDDDESGTLGEAED